jgi:hypothetical protein
VSLSDLGAAAVTYAGGWGWPVFPLRPDSKIPATPNGFHDATTDTAAIVETWTRSPRANVAIVTGATAGLVVIDVDGEKGRESLAELKRTLGPLPTTLAAATPRGAHGYFLHPDVEVRCSAGLLGAGVDVRAEGGYIVAPPSRNGTAGWSWRLPTGQAEPLPHDLAPLPASWVEAMTKRKTAPVVAVDETDPRYVEAAVRAELRAVETAPVGERNSTLNRATYALARFVQSGAIRDRNQLAAALVKVASVAGLEEEESRRTVASAFAARGVAA